MAERPEGLRQTNRWGWRVVDGVLEVWCQDVEDGEWRKVESGPGGDGGTVQRWGLGSQERIALLPTGTPVAVFDTGDWDDLQLREVGQAIYDPVTEQWIATYSARRASDAFASIGAALSDDGETWTPHPQNPIAAIGTGPHANDAHEDPYICKDLTTGEVWRDSSGRALMFTEEKDGATQLGINLFRTASNSLEDWTLFGQVLDVGDAGQWDETDRDSPVVFHHDGWLWMLYEGRNLPDQQGWIGLAVSADEGETWSLVASPYWQIWADEPMASDPPFADPSAEGTWFSLSLVPDDVVMIDGAVVLLCHGQGVDENYHCGRFVARTNPFTIDDGSWAGWAVRWAMVASDPIDSEADTIMCFGNDPTRAVHLDDAAHEMHVQLVVPGSVPPLDRRVGELETAVAPLAGLAEVVDGVSADVDDLGSVLAAESALNDDQDLLIGRIAPRTAVESFDLTTGDFEGPTPGGTLTLPDAVIESTVPPYDGTGSCMALAFSPAPPTSDARLLGAKVRLSVDGVDLIDVRANVLVLDMGGFSPLPARVAITGGWTAPDPVTYVVADLDDPAAGDEQELVFHLDPIVDTPDPGAFGIFVGYQQTDIAPDIGAGSAIHVHSIDWLWDYTPASGGGAVESVNGQTGAVELTAADVGAATEFYVDDSIDAIEANGAVTGPLDSLSMNLSAFHVWLLGKLAAGQGVSLTVNGDDDIVIAVTSLAITNTSVVASEAAMLALTAQEGDVAIRVDTSTTWILGTGASTDLASWHQLATPTDAVLSVAGKTGAITLAIADVTGLQTALDAKAAATHTHAASDISGRTRLIARQGQGTELVSSTTETRILIAAITLPALGTPEAFRGRLGYRFFNNSGASRLPTFRIKLGVTTIFTVTPGALGSNAADRIGVLEFEISSGGANEQRGWAQASHGVAGGTEAGIPDRRLGVGIEAVQTAGLALDITAQLAASASTLAVQMDSFTLEKVGS